MPVIYGHHITPMRLSKTAAVIIALLLAVGPAVYGWTAVRTADRQGCFLDDTRTFRIVSVRTVEIDDRIQPGWDAYARALIVNPIEGAAGRRVYVHSVGGHLATDRRQPSATVTPHTRDRSCQLDLNSQHGLTRASHLYLHTNPPPTPSTIGFVYSTPTLSTADIPSAGTPFPPPSWEAPFSAEYVEPIGLANAAGWRFFIMLFTVTDFAVLFVIALIAWYQLRDSRG